MSKPAHISTALPRVYVRATPKSEALAELQRKAAEIEAQRRARLFAVPPESPQLRERIVTVAVDGRRVPREVVAMTHNEAVAEVRKRAEAAGYVVRDGGMVDGFPVDLTATKAPSGAEDGR